MLDTLPTIPKLQESTEREIVSLWGERKQELKIQANLQKHFLKVFALALCDIAGQNWGIFPDSNKEQIFLTAKRLVAKKIREIDAAGFNEYKSNFDSYFSTVKKCLWYNISEWSVAKSTSIEIFEVALETINKKRNSDGTYFVEKLPYEKALINEINNQKVLAQALKDEKSDALARTDVNNLRAPSVNGKSDEGWLNESFGHIISMYTHPSTINKLEGESKDALGACEILNIATKLYKK